MLLESSFRREIRYQVFQYVTSFLTRHDSAMQFVVDSPLPSEGVQLTHVCDCRVADAGNFGG